MKYSTKIYGHRGASYFAPENTMEAFQLAYKMGADGIEFDVHMTKDGEIVVAHDEEINRVSNGKGMIADMTLRELRAFSFSKLRPQYGNIKIPLLTDVLEEFRSKSFLFNIELKNNHFFYEGMEAKVLKMINDMKLLERTIFSSFHHKSMLQLRAMDERADAAILYKDWILDIPKYIGRYGLKTVHPALKHLRRGRTLKKLHEKKFTVNVWTVNSATEMMRLCNMGVDGIITDRPDLGSEIRDNRKE